MSIFETMFPSWALERKTAMIESQKLDMIAQFYDSGSYEKQSFKTFTPPFQMQPSRELKGESQVMNSRAWDLSRNDAIVTAIKKTLSTGVVGTGIKAFPRPVAKFAGITDKAAEEWAEKAKFLFDSWAESPYSDSTGQTNFYAIQNMVFINSIISGNGWTALQMFDNPTGISGIRLQGIDPFRIQTPMKHHSDKRVADGIRVNSAGKPTYIYIKQFDGVDGFTSKPDDFVTVKIHGKHKRNILHVFTADRFDQYKGVSLFAPIMEDLVQVKRYTEAELMGAVISSYFTAFITNPLGEIGKGLQGVASPLQTETDYRLGPGLVTGLAKGEDVKVVSRDNANASYDGFYNTLVTTITAALGLPKDMVLNHFNKSFSASKAAFLQASKTFNQHRKNLASQWSNHIYETFITEQVLKGNLSAPGFLTDPVKKSAYLNKLWVGEALGLLDPKAEAAAYTNLAEQGFMTRTQVSLELNGSDYKENVKILGAEQKLRDKHKVILGEVTNQTINSVDGDLPKKPTTAGAKNESKS